MAAQQELASNGFCLNLVTQHLPFWCEMSGASLVPTHFISGVQRLFTYKNPCPRQVKLFQLWRATFVFTQLLLRPSLGYMCFYSWNHRGDTSSYLPLGFGANYVMIFSLCSSTSASLFIIFLVLLTEYSPFQLAIFAILRAKKLSRVCFLDGYKVMKRR